MINDCVCSLEARVAWFQRSGRCIWALILFLVSACCARAGDIPNPFPASAIHVTTLANGLRVVVKEDHTLPIVALVVAVRSGSAAEMNTHGKAHLLEHLVFQGTKRYPAPLAPQQALEQAGGVTNAVTSRDAIRFQAAIASDKADLLVNVLYDVVMAPLLSDSSFERERPIVLAEIQREDDNPVVTAIGNAYRVSYKTHPYRHNPSGGIPDILRLTAAEVRAFHQRWFVSKNISLVFVGDITPARAQALVARGFGLVKPVAPPALPPFETALLAKPGQLHTPTQMPQTYQAMAFATPPSSDFPRMVATDVLLTLLVDGPDAVLPGWYQAQRVSSSDFGGEFVSTRAPGRLILWAETEPGGAAPLREATLSLLARMAAGEIDDEALELAQRRLATSFVLENETYSQQAATLAFYESLGGAPLASRYIPIIATLKHEQVRAAVPTTLLGWVTVGQSPEGGQ
jgi:zinc protease